MRIEEIRQRARTVGLAPSARQSKAELIRAIQRSEGNQDCFGSAWRYDCPWPECCWREDCHSKKPG